MQNKKFIMLIVIIFISCQSDSKNANTLTLTNDELVQAMVEMYAVNAALNTNDASFRDSTSQIYYNKVADITGKPYSVIKSDFEKLLLMPDTLLLIQSRALDTLRSLMERTMKSPAISIGIN
ncbi:MAG: hypothetical protein IPL55_22255 [Saprospiraceae bacterium]|nr:hypothetical protein [Saprospiraceae bacterium]MBL0025092.1 hypothetical protein [Saprospiraceae bacterium]